MPTALENSTQQPLDIVEVLERARDLVVNARADGDQHILVGAEDAFNPVRAWLSVMENASRCE